MVADGVVETRVVHGVGVVKAKTAGTMSPGGQGMSQQSRWLDERDMDDGAIKEVACDWHGGMLLSLVTPPFIVAARLAWRLLKRSRTYLTDETCQPRDRVDAR